MVGNSKASKWRETPQGVREAVQKAESGVADLQAIADTFGLKRKFTLDGRLVGDIGELLLCADFEVRPAERPDGHAHDLVGESTEGPVQVQVKFRRATRGRIEFKYQPQCLVLIECKPDWSQWRIVYNGPGNVVRTKGIKVRKKDRRILLRGEPHLVYLTLQRLRDAADGLPAGAPRLAAR
jgi:hypothetical protein